MSLAAVAAVSDYRVGNSDRKFILLVVANNNWVVNANRIQEMTEIPIGRIEKILNSNKFWEQRMDLIMQTGERP